MILHRALAATAAMVFSVPSALWAAQEGGPGIFDVNPGTTVWTGIVFLILLGILWKFAWGPILAMVDAREAGIQGALDRAAEERDEAAKLLAEHRQQMAEARRDAQQVIAEGREAGERVRQDIEEKARTEGQAMIERARQAIEREKETALDAIRQEAVELALAATAKLLQAKMDTEMDRELVLGYLSELGNSGGSAKA